jgi:hypothetical protein
MSRTEARVAVEAELRVLNLTKPMTAKQLELFCNDVCERLNFTLTKSDRREEVVSWVEHAALSPWHVVGFTSLLCSGHTLAA